MTHELVALTAPRDRRVGLSLAARLSRVGIPSVLVPSASALDPWTRGGFAVSVPRTAASEAARHLATWSGAMGHEGAYRTPEAIEEEPLPDRSRRLAACFALGLGFGLGHTYAREYLAGALIALGQLACLVLSARGIHGALWAFPALMLLDLFGAMGAVTRANDGAPRESTSQLASTLPAVALLVAGAAVLVPSATIAERPPATWSAR